MILFLPESDLMMKIMLIYRRIDGSMKVIFSLYSFDRIAVMGIWWFCVRLVTFIVMIFLLIIFNRLSLLINNIKPLNMLNIIAILQHWWTPPILILPTFWTLITNNRGAINHRLRSHIKITLIFTSWQNVNLFLLLRRQFVCIWTCLW